MAPLEDCRRVDSVLHRLAWMRDEGIWPHGKRYLWTDAHGVVLSTSLYRATGYQEHLERAEWLVREVERVLGRVRGIRIGEDPDRAGQYYHYLALWIFALSRLGRLVPGYRERAVELAREIHRPFVVPGRGVWWKMEEDLSGPADGLGFGALDPFDGYIACSLLDEASLAMEIAELRRLVEASWRGLRIDQDLGLGMMLWMCSIRPDEPWARFRRRRSLEALDDLWLEHEGCFCRSTRERGTRLAFTNHGVSIGLQAVGEWPERVERIRAWSRTHRSHDHYDRDAITHVMACCAELPGDFMVKGGALRGSTAGS
jgi:hypothetical protein